jgi:endonuclease/exonuclease/phosphatase family metal-dependent hydrolase
MRKKNWFKRLAGILKLLTIITLLGLVLAYLSPFVHPDTFWIIPFFGLLYPVFLIISICLFCLFAIYRSKWSLLILIVILTGGSLHFRQFAFGKEVKSTEANATFSVMSYNVRLFDLYNWSVDSSNVTRHKIFDFLNEQQPDIACFQEFYHQDKSKTFPTRDSLVDMLQTVDYHERYSHKVKGRRNFGIAIMSKFPMIAKGEVPLQLAPGSGNDNYCIFADIVKDGDTIRVYNVHLQSIKIKSDEFTYIDETGAPAIDKSAAFENVVTKLRKAYPMRAEQAKLVIGHAQESPYPVVICGDFNDTPLSYTYQQFQKVYKDAFRELSKGIGATYAGKIPAGRIDYIFYSTDLNGYDFTLQTETLSDHHAIWCNFERIEK